MQILYKNIIYYIILFITFKYVAKCFKVKTGLVTVMTEI